MDDNIDLHYTDRGEYNQRVGKELYNQDKQNPPQRYRGYRGTPDDRQWSEGNNFHTGPSPRGAQDRHLGGFTSGSNEQHRNLRDHYGSRPGSTYRTASQHLNYGDGRRPYTAPAGFGNTGSSGQRAGNFSDLNDYQNDMYREGPGSGSRYKETDFRYGSGSHNWYREGRYTADETENRDTRGFLGRLKDTWDDIWNSDNPDYEPRNLDTRQDLYNRQRRNPQAYSNRDFNRGYEGGPRWADETDSGKDNYYNDTDPGQRYRR